MKLYIKNMVCPRCISAVENLLNEMHARPVYVQLGEVVLAQSLAVDQLIA